MGHYVSLIVIMVKVELDLSAGSNVLLVSLTLVLTVLNLVLMAEEQDIPVSLIVLQQKTPPVKNGDFCGSLSVGIASTM